MDEKMLGQLMDKLDTIIKLMILLKSEGKSMTEQVKILSAAGLQPKEIAEILGTTPNTVRVTLVNIRKQKRKK